MSKTNRFEITPQEHIMNMYEQTCDGKIAVTYYPTNGEKPYSLTYTIDWTKEDAENAIKEYEALVAALHKIGDLHNVLANESDRKRLLSPEELSVWETYIQPFNPFAVDMSVIEELYLRAEFDELSEDENELLERFYEWRNTQSAQRLPFLQRSPANVILSASRYERLLSLNAPKVIVNEEARCLAEEMVLYYYAQ